jgi:DNA-binding beta-propeller fold protein YncE
MQHKKLTFASGAACRLAGIVICAAHCAHAEPLANQAVFRRPVALSASADGRLLYVANRRSGTISSVDAARRCVVREHAVGRRLSDLAALPDGRLAALDEAAHELLLVRPGDTDGELVIERRIAVAPYPVSVSIAADGGKAFVASLWSRRLSTVDLADARPGVVGTLSLPFAPREQLLIADGTRLIVADSFGGKLAIIDTARGAIEAIRELPAHNIRGLALDATGRKLLVSHQILNSLAETTHNDVHWGILLINVLRWLSLDRVLDTRSAILQDSHVHPAGDSDGAGGDPAGLAVCADGTVVMALAGMGRVALGREADYALRSVPAGARPTAVQVAADGTWACVANTLGDSLTFIDIKAGQAISEASLGPMPQPSASDRGESLYFDARLSLDGWFSCHSCHTDGHTNGLLVDNLSDGSFGSAKRVLSLLGTGQTGPWAWNGGMTDLDGQIRRSIESTMQGETPTDAQVSDLAAYLRTLEPPPASASLSVDGPELTTDIEHGSVLFHSLGCADCHRPDARYTTAVTHPPGLAGQQTTERFNPPSLLGVSQGGPYLHDNRAANLAEVFTKHRHQLSAELTPAELSALLRFLESL